MSNVISRADLTDEVTVPDLRAKLTALVHATDGTPLANLAASLAHEINNPLGYLQTNLEFVAEELAKIITALSAHRGPLTQRLPGLSAAAEAIDDAAGAVARITKVAAGLRTLAHRDAQPTELLNLNSCVEQALEAIEGALPEGTSLECALGAGTLVQGDRRGLTQIFIELLRNAAQALSGESAGGLRLRVTTGVDGSGRVFAEIEDSGVGISPELREHVFEPFFTTRGDQGGNGLGLASAHALLAEIKGDLTLEAATPHGTIARVTLPRVVRPPHLVETTHPGKRRVLVIDDERATCFSLVRMLRGAYDVHWTTDPLKGMERIESGERFDLILSDLVMPKVTGPELYQRLRTLVPTQAERMAFMTGGATTAATRQFLASCPGPRLEKPFQREALLTLVAAWTEG